MKIVFFINTLSSGGAEHQMCYLASFLSEYSYDITIATYGDLPDHYVFDRNIKRVRIAPKKNKFVKLLSIVKYFITLEADVVISFCQQNNLLAIPGLLLNPSIRLIVSERNFSVGGITSTERILFRFLYKRAKYIVPNSYAQAKFIIENSRQLREKIRVITNYTDTDLFSNVNNRQFHSEKRICVFARYAQQKNFEGFAYCINKLKKSGYRFKVDWFGDIYTTNQKLNPYYEKFINLIEALNISDLITLNNAIEDVNKELTKYDAFCLPSFYEGFSNSISEAISCGLPVLAGNISDNQLMVKEGVNGFLFDPNNIESMATALSKFLDLSTHDIESMGLESRKLALSLFDKKGFIDKYLELLR